MKKELVNFHHRLKRLSKEELRLIADLLPKEMMETYLKNHGAKYRPEIRRMSEGREAFWEKQVATMIHYAIQRADWSLIEVLHEYIKSQLIQLKKHLKLAENIEREITFYLGGDLVKLFKLVNGLNLLFPATAHVAVLKLAVDVLHQNQIQHVQSMNAVLRLHREMLLKEVGVGDFQGRHQQLKEQNQQLLGKSRYLSEKVKQLEEALHTYETAYEESYEESSLSFDESTSCNQMEPLVEQVAEQLDGLVQHYDELKETYEQEREVALQQGESQLLLESLDEQIHNCQGLREQYEQERNQLIEKVFLPLAQEERVTFDHEDIPTVKELEQMELLAASMVQALEQDSVRESDVQEDEMDLSDSFLLRQGQWYPPLQAEGDGSE